MATKTPNPYAMMKAILSEGMTVRGWWKPTNVAELATPQAVFDQAEKAFGRDCMVRSIKLDLIERPTEVPGVFIDMLDDEVRAFLSDLMDEIQIEQCSLCRAIFKTGGDAWDDLCPGCADRVSEYMDQKGISESTTAVEQLIKLDEQEKNK